MTGRATHSRRRLRLEILAGLVILAAFPAQARQKFAAEVRLRLPDGKEEVRRVADLRFVYYERRFIRKSTGFGKPPRLEIKDLPHEESFLQNEALKKVKFLKVRRITFAAPEGEGKPARLVIEIKKKGKPPIEWPVPELRNSSTSRTPHFRGRYQDQDADFVLPGPAGAEKPAGSVVIDINFDFPGRIPPRKRF